MKAAHFSASLRPRDRFPACHGRVLQAGFERKRGRTAQQRGSALAAIAFSAPSVCPRRDPCKKPAPERLLCPSFSLPLLHFPAFVHSYHLFHESVNRNSVGKQNDEPLTARDAQFEIPNSDAAV